MSDGRKARRQRALLALSALAIAAALAEGLTRVGIIRNDRQRVEQVRRTWERSSQRVVLLGDSFLATSLGAMLTDDLAEYDTAVFNLAINGMGPYEYLERIRSARLQTEPDLVIMGYYIGNDLTNVRDRSGNAQGGLDAPPNLLPYPYFDFYLDDHLRANLKPRVEYEFDWDLFAEIGIDSSLIEDARAGRMNPWLLSLAATRPNYLLDNVLIEGEANQKAWETVKELVLEIRSNCEVRGARFIVVIFPRSIQVDDSHFEFFRDLTFAVDGKTLASTRPQDLMIEFCIGLGIPVLDLLPSFKERSGEELYRVKDDHFNQRGDRLAAEGIVPFILRHIAAGS